MNTITEALKEYARCYHSKPKDGLGSHLHTNNGYDCGIYLYRNIAAVEKEQTEILERSMKDKKTDKQVLAQYSKCMASADDNKSDMMIYLSNTTNCGITLFHAMSETR